MLGMCSAVVHIEHEQVKIKHCCTLGVTCLGWWCLLLFRSLSVLGLHFNLAIAIKQDSVFFGFSFLFSVLKWFSILHYTMFWFPDSVTCSHAPSSCLSLPFSHLSFYWLLYPPTPLISTSLSSLLNFCCRWGEEGCGEQSRESQNQQIITFQTFSWWTMGDMNRKCIMNEHSVS